MYERNDIQKIINRLREPRKFMQVVMGPRQVGKTTGVKQALKKCGVPYLFFTADAVPASSHAWISECWTVARQRLKSENLSEIILVIDEIQKISNWSEIVKKEWDMDSFNEIPVKIVLLGSSRVMIAKGLSESLAGRFESIKMSHWNLQEMQDAFGFTMEEYIYYGGYPGAADLIHDAERWEEYIHSSIIESTINKDILMNTPINKPALLRQTFELSSSYSGEILSLTKMLGSLQDAGNTTTLSSYLNLLNDSGLVTGLQKYAVDMARKRASVPKFQVYNNSLKNVYSNKRIDDALSDPRLWGRIYESAIGAHIVTNALIGNYEVYYWREGNMEVDYLIKKKNELVAIEVKSNDEMTNKGLEYVRDHFNCSNTLIVGPNGFPVETFLKMSPADLF
ncbi:MAG: AAA family ATPase [Paludibacteraceae bacterium]|nr:AAA family ATPase [Paludibacteraceae bacterium]